ncbi:hypothetical protein HYQ45_017385 [Verticillium longisporum]|uniref:Uncharacterized protein n=1 Tax=Verticillium longisporum TaxID=100787 RepID=A0A8I2Z4X6_VERLO|nr:hypothetical protein HYQ45_017385 [Verticillium longisporum]
MSGVVTESADGELGGDEAECPTSPTDVRILSDISKRVQVKEDAIHFALDILKRQRLMLRKLAPTDISDIADWPERSGAVKLERSALKREWLEELSDIAHSTREQGGLVQAETCNAPSKIILEAKKKTVPFLDTKNSTKKHTSGRSRGIIQHWPLVQQSRAAVAKDFFERLDKLIVVVHAVRAADNKAGSDAMLMPATLSMDMGLDGRFEPDSLAVIVTKVDDINPKNAENDFPDDETIMTAVSTLEAENEELVNLEELISRQREIIDDHDEEESETELKRSCIQARNLKVKQAVGQNLGDIKAQVNPTAIPVVGEFESSVLPISASAFLDINAGDSVIGFADANDTGIPALRDWLTQRNEKVSYMTYKACVRRGGHEWTTSAKPRMTYNWMSSVSLNFWRAHARFWQEAFFQRLPKIINDAESRNTRIFNDFITDLVTDDEIPAGFCDLLRRRVPSLQTQRDVFLQEVRSTGNDFRNDALRLKPHVSDIFTKHMAPVFAKAFSITGVGAFVEQKKVVKEQFESKLPEMLQEARNFIEEELVSSKTQRVNKLRGSISTHNGKPGIRLIELDKIFKNLLRDARAPASKIAGRSQGTQSEAVTAAKETIRAALGEWHGYWQPIEQALPKRPTTMVSDDSENEEEEEELEAPGKKKTAGGKAKPKAKPKANKAPPKPKAAPRPRASSKANVDALPQPKIVKAKAQPRSMSVVKTEEDDEMHTGGTMADDAPHTGGSPANRQQIGAMMAAVTAETESLSGHRQDNSAK